MEREKFGSRLGFILISAGCAIGLGNVWRFPYIVGKYGGAAFLLIYFLFLIIFGIPIMVMEFSVGRASRKSVAGAFRVLEPKGTKWHLFSGIGVIGNYLLMMFYTTITGFMFVYFIKMVKGDFANIAQKLSASDLLAGAASGDPITQYISNEYDAVVSNPWLVVGFMLLTVVLGFFVCSLGFRKGVEKITKVMMLALLAIISVLAIRSVTLDGAMDGLRYYLVPNFEKMAQYNIGEVIFAAMGQAFFTLSIGMGSMAIFGSYIGRERSLLGESVSIALLDTFVAFVAGLIVIPACSAYQIAYDSGPDLLFQTLPRVFASMPGGRIWGSFFFLFMIFAAMSTVIAVFENIVNFGMELWGWSRRKAVLINMALLVAFSLPCALGFNLLSFIHPFGEDSNIMDLEDFIISSNILPLGSLVYVLFCTSKKYGWGWDNFIAEANAGNGWKFPRWLYFYAKFILPIIVLAVWVLGYLTKFFGLFS